MPDHPAVGDLYGVRTERKLRRTTECFASAYVEPAIVLGALDDGALEVAIGEVRLGVGAQPVRQSEVVFSQAVKSVRVALVVDAPHLADSERAHGAEVRAGSSHGAVSRGLGGSTRSSIVLR